jgi:hypothetical protein
MRPGRRGMGPGGDVVARMGGRGQDTRHPDRDGQSRLVGNDWLLLLPSSTR